MANFPGLVLTQAGRNLQAKAQIGAPLTFSRVALGDGTSNAPDAMTALANELLSLSIQEFEVVGDGTSRMRVIMTNEALENGFFVRELGVFAEDPDTGEEQLYSYSNAGDQPDFLPAGGGATLVENVFDLYTVVGNAQNVTAKINDYITIATKQDIDVIRPYILPTGGLTGQVPRKASNAEGDTEWFDPAEGVAINVHSVSETRTAVGMQSVFNLRERRTSGLAVYVDGKRLTRAQWKALNATQVQLNTAVPDGTVVEFVNNEEVGTGGMANVSLTGPDLVYPGSSNTYTITGYDGFSAYTVDTDVGTVSRTDDTVTLDIPVEAAAGVCNLTITRNDGSTTFQIAVGAQAVAAPTMLSPVDGATDVGGSPTLTTSAFVTYPSEADTHVSTDWQLSLAPDFSTILWESLGDTENLESIKLPSGIVPEGTKIYGHAQHNGTTLGGSGYSDVVSFTTSDSFYPANEIAKLLATDAQASDALGSAVAISRDGLTAIVGAPNEDAGGSDAGAAYIFVRSGGNWSQVTKLVASDAQAGDEFGYSVAISGDSHTVIVGAWRKDTGGSGAGAAYIYTNSSGVWVEVAKITSSDIAAGDLFGNACALNADGSTAVIGAFAKDAAVGSAGAVYVFSNATGSWLQASKLLPDEVATRTDQGSRFGISVDITPDASTIVAGARYASGGGAAYIFDNISGWAQTGKVAPVNGGPQWEMGNSVGISDDGNTVIAGDHAYGVGYPDNNTGAAYIFSRASGSWTITARLQASSKASQDYFGWSVDISGDGNTAVVGSYYDDDKAPSAGAAYIFVNNSGTWSQSAQLTASDAQSNDQFGYYVAISGDGSSAIAGSRYNNDNGSAYIFA